MASKGEKAQDSFSQQQETISIGETKEVVFSMVGGKQGGEGTNRVIAFNKYLEVVRMIGEIPGVAKAIPETFSREQGMWNHRTRLVTLELHSGADFTEILEKIRDIKPVINAVDQARLA